jgi:hypothetical protein
MNGPCRSGVEALTVCINTSIRRPEPDKPDRVGDKVKPEQPATDIMI